ncbi:efflux transporter outer membrane subunit [Algiphilus sp. W345]|uniref:Efflux transporter outer membrane subunit n=1 Tax=Banduia mediterranea TaxID=3075609 RepID=A0ABU2WFS5_9GAMM|nr:efflux transporter outer membrane subunit [Algiphilus sp. W345]MDT0496727.1 efflux transporter outer membrane subunit [Algiphilus sp. W345]
MRVCRLAPLVLAAILAACADMQGIAPQTQPASIRQLSAGQDLSRAQSDAVQWPQQQWWKRYGDPQLDALVDRAVVGNPSLAESRARLRAATAATAAARAATGNDYSVGASFDRMRYSENVLIPPEAAGTFFWNSEVMADVSRDLDLWHREDYVVEGALDRQQAVACELQAARLALQSAVVDSYLRFALQFALRHQLQDQLADARHGLDIASQQLAAGIGTDFDVERARGEIPDLQAQRQAVDLQIELLRHQLAALAGAGPGDADALEPPQLNVQAAAALPADLPAGLLGRRPDIVARRLTVEADARDVDAARTRFYPDINLRAFAGLASIKLDSLLQANSLQAGFGPAISLPVFAGNSLRANLRGRSASYDQAVAEYNASLVDALHQVADQVSTIESLAAQIDSRQQRLDSAERTASLARDRFQAGLSNYLDVLDARRQLRAARTRLLGLRYQQMEAAVALTAALGGGFDGSSAGPRLASTAPTRRNTP